LTKLTLDFADLRSDRISLLSHGAADPGPNSMSMLRNMVPEMDPIHRNESQGKPGVRLWLIVTPSLLGDRACRF